MRLAVISPFLDRKHGTERCVIEQLERFPVGAENEIHIHAQRVQDLHGVIPYSSKPTSQRGRQLWWHRVASIRGPHLLGFIFWFCANTVSRWRSARNGLKYDLVYSAGINASNADAIAVHVVFREVYRRLRPQLGFRGTSVRHWPRLIHRRLYYRLIMALENQIYRQPHVSLAAVSRLVSEQLDRHYQRSGVRVIHHGVDAKGFSVSARLEARVGARERLGIEAGEFVLLLIGNDLKNKGLDALLRALAGCGDLSWKLLVVGDDAYAVYEKLLRDMGIAARVLFLPSSPKVLQFYAAADAYAGPSLEDAFGMPVLEAMACGLPVVSSSHAGVSELITSGIDGIVLNDPQDPSEVASALRKMMTEPEWCRAMGEQATMTTQKHSWDQNAAATWQWLCEVNDNKRKAGLGSD